MRLIQDAIFPGLDETPQEAVTPPKAKKTSVVEESPAEETPKPTGRVRPKKD